MNEGASVGKPQRAEEGTEATQRPAITLYLVLNLEIRI